MDALVSVQLDCTSPPEGVATSGAIEFLELDAAIGWPSALAVTQDGIVYVTDIEGDRARYDIVTYATRPGDIIVNHYKTLHGSDGNASRDHMRRAISVRYCGDDVRYCFRPSAPPQPHHRRRHWQDGLSHHPRAGGPARAGRRH